MFQSSQEVLTTMSHSNHKTITDFYILEPGAVLSSINLHREGKHGAFIDDTFYIYF